MEKDTYLDMDLALYKAKEDDLSTFYLIYIIYLESATNGWIVSEKILDASCEGWQVFHLSSFISTTLQANGTNNMHFRILAFKNGLEGMSCSQISELFLMRANQEDKDSSQEDKDSSQEDKGSGEPNNETELVEEDNALEEGAPENDDAFTISSDFEPIDYIPVITVFTTKNGRAKRDAGTMSSITQSGGGACHRVDKHTRLESVKIADEEYSVVHPTTYNIGECRYEGAEGSLSSTEHCVPTGYKSTQMLVQKKTAESRHYAIHRNTDLIIDSCGLL